MHELLRDHANILRSLATELDNVATTLEGTGLLPPVGVVKDIDVPAKVIDESVSYITTYYVERDLNWDGLVPMIRHDLLRKNRVQLKFRQNSEFDVLFTSDEEFSAWKPVFPW